jgi:PucR C-terminal helix-turn-helix domain
VASVVDTWRAVDPAARLLTGSAAALGRPARLAVRTRSAPPLLPTTADGAILVADASPFGSVGALLSALAAAELTPAAVLLHGSVDPAVDRAAVDLPVLVSDEQPAVLQDRAVAYLADESGWLERLALQLRLACAEAALSEPDPATPAGVVSARIRRGVAVTADGELRSLHPREAGRALAARFVALHGRLLAAGSGQGVEVARRTRDGLYLLERRIRPGASAWLFDDLPLAASDEVALEAAAVTLRALLRRRPESAAPRSGGRPRAAAPAPVASNPLTATLVVVARHNGRVAPAARELGVHRNTVLYRLRRAQAELGVDPRRPDDALRILRENAEPA